MKEEEKKYIIPEEVEELFKILKVKTHKTYENAYKH